MRAGLRTIINAEPDLEVVGEASDGEAAVALASSAQPDVLLMDVRMPGVDGIRATDRLTGLAAVWTADLLMAVARA